MKKFLTQTAWIAGLLVSQLGAAQSFVINPYNVASSCMYYGTTTVRDHRYNPVRISYLYTAVMRNCSEIAAYKRMTIKYMNGADFNGSEGYVTVKNSANLCMTNPASYTGGADTGVVRFEACQAQNGSIAAARQRFYVKRNNYGATRFESHLQYAMALPNAKKECLERTNPTNVVRQVCGNLNNWMVNKVN